MGSCRQGMAWEIEVGGFGRLGALPYLETASAAISHRHDKELPLVFVDHAKAKDGKTEEA